MSGLKLRDYQHQAADAVFDAWDQGIQRPAVVLPTGAGKTVIFGQMASSIVASGGRVLVLVHRDELVRQTVAKVHAADPSISVGVIKALRHEIDADVIVASIQSLRPARLATIDPYWISHIVVDECHHAVAQSYLNVLRHFGCRAVGFTATMSRQDSKGLADVWDQVVYTKSILWMIRNGYLVDVAGMRVDAELDLNEVKRSGGDYQAGDLGEALEAADIGHVILRALDEHGGDRQGVIFLPTVSSAEAVADTLAENGVKAEVITGDTPPAERQAIYARVRAGVTRHLVNCMVLTEGFDEPQLSMAVIARPTTSSALYVQMVGRVLRLFPGKADALVLDVVGVTGKLKLASLTELSGTREIQEGEYLTGAEDREAKEDQEQAEGPAKTIKPETITSTLVDLFASSRMAWLQTPKGRWFIPAGEWTVGILPLDSGPDSLVSVAAVYTGRGYRQPTRKIVSEVTLDYAMAWGEDAAEELDGAGTFSERDRKWRKTKPSTAQLAMASRMGIDVGPEVRKGELSDLISSVMAGRFLDGWNPPAPKITDEEEN